METGPDNEAMCALQRNVDSFGSSVFDVVIVGGGIVGAALAWDASLRGAKVALLERGDFGGATTAGNFKIIHGGLRYLQHLDFSRTIESVREQYIFRKNAPHLVHPLPFLVPCYGRGAKSKAFLELGLSVYDFISRRRNRFMPESHTLPRYRSLSPAQCLDYAPGLSGSGLTGGVLFHDCHMSNSDRLTLSFIIGAAECGAVVANYVEAERFEMIDSGVNAGSIRSVTARDLLSGKSIEVRGRVFLNATGPWLQFLERGAAAERFLELAPPESLQGGTVYSKGIQLAVPRITKGVAISVQSSHRDRTARVRRGGRSYFIQPWNDLSLVGTGDISFSGHPDDFEITDEEVDRFLADVREAYRVPQLTRDSVHFAFGGLRPVDPVVKERMKRGAIEEYGSVEASREDRVVFHSASPLRIANLVSVEGIKYTTVRALAEDVMDEVQRRFALRMRPCQTRDVPMAGGDIRDFATFVNEMEMKTNGALSRSQITRLVRNYGTKTNDIVRLITRTPAMGTAFDGETQVCPAEVAAVAKSEMVGRLSDVVLRRVPFWQQRRLRPETLRRVGYLVGNDLGWDAHRIGEEISLVEQELERRIPGERNRQIRSAAG